MRRVLPPMILLLALGGCAASGPLSYAGSAGCGLVTAARLALAGLPCAPPPAPPAPYCTRSLADVDCWEDPGRLRDHPPQVADGGWVAPKPVAAARKGVGKPVPP